MINTPWGGGGGFGGGGAPAAGGGGGVNPWLQGLAQRIAQARQGFGQPGPQRMPQPMGGPGGSPMMGMPWQGPTPGAGAAAGGMPQTAGGSPFAPGWSNRFSGFAAPASPDAQQPGQQPRMGGMRAEGGQQQRRAAPSKPESSEPKEDEE